ncbi:SMODS domain-containing nucleotidyltransferase [Tunicatimonas pelagia]|uniref:SMODS domain-containing nucleotidyltransferase n=1 Tax=Tunicatimonas pelagia TaxID=931531 RepID=UPI002666AFCE|nr:hypothetical protein [Tunicatimonas pelagia]WKN44910.1 hypothetical protein P0M28_08035 [Tunicatimonas pelagia]
MYLPSYFNDFLSNIRLSPNQKNDLIKGHKTLVKRLKEDKDLAPYIVSIFLQGSYRRYTAVAPVNGKRADVDVIIVTRFDKNSVTPEQAIEKFIPFVEKHYKGKYEIQGRSIGIELSYVDLDIVVTAAPSEADEELLRSESVTTMLTLEDSIVAQDWKLIKSWLEPGHRSGDLIDIQKSYSEQAEWKTEPLHIPDREANCWIDTHPLEQIRWTQQKNKDTNGHYVNVVKSLKWYRKINLVNLKYPKGYPIEHMIGDCCPDEISSVAEGIMLTLENIVSSYQTNYLTGQVPTLPDRGVPDHNVWKRVSIEDFKSFYDSIKEAAVIARKAYEADTVKEAVANWQILFGKKFPDAPDDGNNDSGDSTTNPSGGFSSRKNPTIIGGGRFA